MKWAAAFAFAAALLVATEAHTSSAYGNSIATSAFRYSFNEHVRKAFSSDEQARSYMERHDRAMKARFLAFQAKAERAVQNSGLPVAPYDLMRSATIDAKTYPLNIVIALENANAEELFEITLTKPATAAQVAALKSALAGVVNVTPDQVNDATALIDAAQFELPIAVTQIDEKFGLYVGTTTEVPVQERERVMRQLRATLDKLLPKVRERFAAQDVVDTLSVKGLQKMKPVDANVFHPWGPLSSGEYVRVRADVGHVSAILMIAPVGSWEWDRVYPGLNAVLQGAVTP